MSARFRSDIPWLIVILVVSQALPHAVVRIPVLLAVVVVIAARVLVRLPAFLGARPPLGILLFVLLVVASAIWSIDPVATLVYGTQLILLTIGAIYIGSSYAPPQIYRGFRLSLQSLIAMSILAELAAVAGVDFQPRSADLMYGALSNPNVLAFISVLAILAVATSRVSIVAKTVWIAASLLLLYGSSSNGGWVYCALAVAAALVLRAIRRVGPVLRVLVTLGAALVAVALLTTEAFWQHLFRISGAVDNVTLSGRTVIWDAAIAGVSQRPWFGHGYEVFGQSGADVPSDMTRLWSDFGFQRFNAHNGYLDLALQVGILGTAFLVLLILRAIRLHFTAYMAGGSAFPALTLITLLAYNLTETRFTVPQFAWLTIVVLIVCSRKVPAVRLGESAGTVRGAIGR